MRASLTVIALGAPIVQVLLMGMIGYPFARNDPKKMERFHRSGFYWWIVATAAIIVLAFILLPSTLSGRSLSGHDFSVVRAGVTLLIGLALVLILEVGADVLATRSGSTRLLDSRNRYEAALPDRLRSAGPEVGVLSLIAVLEEAVYRGIGLSGLLLWADLSEPVAAFVCCLAFGLAHWYFGFEHIVLKSLTASVFCGVAFSIGWVGAAVVHVALNLILILLARRARTTL